MKVEEVAIDKVVPYVRNPRVPGDNSVAKVAGSIKEFGFKQPIVVDGDMVVIVGHTRLEAARQLGLETVPVVIARDLDPVKAKAYRIADNRVAQDSGWDPALLQLELTDLRELAFDLPLLGFEEAELEQFAWRVEAQNGAPTDPNAEWEGMPEFLQNDARAYRSIAVHFRDQEAVDEFMRLLNRPITDKTRYMWFPEMEIERYVDKRYITEPCAEDT